jgi:putative FmdB family regulatory protein
VSEITKGQNPRQDNSRVMVNKVARTTTGAKVTVVDKSHRASSGVCNGRSERRHEVPVYEFVCGDCGPFEQQRSFTELGDPIACASCGREADLFSAQHQESARHPFWRHGPRREERPRAGGGAAARGGHRVREEAPPEPREALDAQPLTSSLPRAAVGARAVRRGLPLFERNQ